MFVHVTTTGVWVFLMTPVIALIVFALLKYLGWIHQTRSGSSTNILNVLAGVFVIAPLGNVNALMDMKERVALDRVALMHALDTEHANGSINSHTSLLLGNTVAAWGLLIFSLLKILLTILGTL